VRRSIVLALTVLAVAASAQAYDVTCWNGAPNNTIRWPGAAMTYHVNAASFGGAGLSTTPITNGFQAWENDAVATIDVTQGAVSSRIPDGQTSDGNSDVIYIASNWGLGAGVLAVTVTFYTGAGDIAEADMLVNGVDFQWDDPTGAGCTVKFDLGATVTHEAGHALGMCHSWEPGAAGPDPCASPNVDAVTCDATMYYAGGPCDTNGESLECDDLAGIRFLYPPGGAPRADWAVAAASATPNGGNVAVGQQVTVSATARNEGSLATNSGTAALYVSSSPTSFSGSPVKTTALLSTGTCRTRDISFLAYSWAAGDAGTRYLHVVLDSTDTTAEFPSNEAPNTAVIGPFTVGANPVLQLSAATLTFDAPQGGAAPPSQSITVTNGGAGSLNWTASDNQPWLSVAPTSGAQGASFDVSVNPTGLSLGDHVGTVTVTAAGAAGSPAPVTVTLTITPATPALSVSPPSLTFSGAVNGSLPASQSLSILNTAGGVMNWSVSDDATWLSVAPASGVDDASVQVSVTSMALPVGASSATITVTAPGATGSPASIPVTLNLTATTPALDVQPPGLTFTGGVGGAAPPSQALTVSNLGPGSLSFLASSNKPWLSVLPTSGTAPQDLTVSVNPAGLPAGTQNGSITVTAAGASGSPKSIGVSFTLTSTPSIALSVAALGFVATPGGAAPAAQSFSVTNDGAGTLSYTIADDAAWLTVTPSNGALSSGVPRSHDVSVDATGLAQGQYVGTITVTAAAANDSPQQVVVTLDVSAAPVLVVDPLSLTFSATPSGQVPPPQSVSISTSGLGSAAWTASTTTPWLSVSPPGGIGDSSVSVQASVAGLSAGAHQGSVRIASSVLAGSPKDVAVTFNVAPGPRLSVSSLQASWMADRGGPLPAAVTIALTNLGTGTIAWTVSGAPSWLDATPASGTTPGSFTLRPNRTDLPAGTHAGSLLVSAANTYDAPRSIDVSYEIVGAGLVLAPERTVIEVRDGAVVSGPASLQASGGAGGSWSASSSVPWLTVSPSSGLPGATTLVSLVGPDRFLPGVYDASIVFTSNGASNSPAPAPVSVIVREGSALSAYPPVLELDAIASVNGQGPTSLAIDDAGDGGAAWTITAKPPWLAASAMTGVAPSLVDLHVNAAGLAAGLLQGDVVLASGADAITVPVHLEVHAVAALRADRERVRLSERAGSVGSQHVPLRIENVGAGSGAFTISTSAPWLRPSGGAGQPPTTLDVFVDASALAAGSYSASLRLVPDGGGATLAVPIEASVAEASAPRAAFTASASEGCAPLTVVFTDATSGAPTAHSWKFGSLGASSAASPTFTFEEPGTHEVTLIASNASGSTSASLLVDVHQPPLADAGPPRLLAFEADGESVVSLDAARVAAAAPARLLGVTWTTSAGTFADTGTATSHLERPVLQFTSNRGGGSATLDLDVVDDRGCAASDSTTVAFLLDFDADSDTKREIVDNCPGITNALQADSDADGWGDNCDSCRNAFDPLRLDLDGDSAGDACAPPAGRSLALSHLPARACDGDGEVRLAATDVTRLRRARLSLGGRQPEAAWTLGAATRAGGSAHVLGAGVVELRVPAGIAPAGEILAFSVPVLPSDDIVAVPCTGALLLLEGGSADATCDDGDVRTRPDADVAPAGAADGSTSIGDVVRMLRASVGLDVFEPLESARADVAPGTTIAGTWQATPDCVVNIADVVIALRASVSLITLER
jgi:PKD repeat protein